MMDATRCLHGMIKATCALCIPPRKARVPVHSTKPTRHGSGAGLVDVKRYGVEIVRTAAKSREHALMDIKELDPRAEMVHIDGSPFLWAIEAILGRLPNLQAIQVIPSALDRFGGSARALCSGRGVQVVGGHVKPELAWEEGRIGNPQYHAQRSFLQGMRGEQLALFEELLSFGFEAAAITARYFCLANEEYVPQRLLVEEYGYSKGAIAIVSALTLSVLFYLDETVEVGDISRRKALTMKQRVTRLRPMIASAERRQQLIRELGLPRLATNFPFARMETFGQLLKAWRSGRMEEMRKECPRDFQAIVLRFGLDRLENPVYKTLTEVGEAMGGVTRERARQLEERGLEWLGISED